MSKSAPNTRIVDALTGEKAPAEFLKALAEADHFCAELNELNELDELHELRTRVQELEAERDELEDCCGKYLNRSAEWQQHSEGLQARIDIQDDALKQALADADDMAETIGHLIRERDGYRESANDLGVVLQSAFVDIAAVRDERDNLASDLADLREAHMHTVTALAQARGERDTFRARIERTGW